MSMSDERKEYLYEYAKKNLKRIPLDVQREKYEAIKAAADKTGETVNGYIKKAVDERMEREGNPPTADQQAAPREPAQLTAEPTRGRQEKHYKPFTEDEAQKIDLQELLSNVRYQLDVSDTFGMDVLTTLLDKARLQSSGKDGE